MIVISLFSRLQVQHKGSEHINVYENLTSYYIGKVHLTGEEKWRGGDGGGGRIKKILINKTLSCMQTSKN